LLEGLVFALVLGVVVVASHLFRLQRNRRQRQEALTAQPLVDLRWETLEKDLDFRISASKGHTKRVTAYTMALARAMGLSSDQIKVIARGAFLHDVGKLAVPESILRALGPLSPAEDATLRAHCWQGYEMVKKVPAIADAAEIVYTHEEHYDGSGYPRGLKGNEIPLGARIVATANALEECTSFGYAGRGLSLADAKQEIARRSGTEFDPAVVNVLLTMPERVWADLRGDTEDGE
jgi:putative nucleotidyltransferase with HDIG domain